LRALLGETWPLRAAVLLEKDGAARESLYGELSALSTGDEASPIVLDAVRRALVAALRSDDRPNLVRDLDRELLGLGQVSPLRAAV
jgi:hypothetical protein